MKPNNNIIISILDVASLSEADKDIESICDKSIKQLVIKGSVERALHYTNYSERLLSIAGFLCLENSLSELGLTPDSQSVILNGKPTLTDKGAFFNISHSVFLSACAASLSYDIGIDIEKITENRFNNDREFYKRFAKRFFCEHECERLALFDNTSVYNNLYYDAAFLSIWTSHEALGKYLGIGYFHGDVDRYMQDNNLKTVKYLIQKDMGESKPSYISFSSLHDIFERYRPSEKFSCILSLCVPSDAEIFRLIFI